MCLMVSLISKVIFPHRDVFGRVFGPLVTSGTVWGHREASKVPETWDG